MKELYADWDVPHSAIKKSPLLAAIRHDKRARGSHQVVPISYGNGGGRSARFSTAQANSQGSQNAKLLVTWVSDYADAQFQGDVADFSAGDGAIEDVVTWEIEDKKMKLINSLCSAMYGDQSGKIGQAAGTDAVGASLITLTNKYDVVNFKVGDTIVTSTSTNPSGVRTGNAQITSIDRANGVLGFAGGVTGSITGYTNTDYVYIDGDYGSKLAGLRSWLPGTSLTSTNFFGVSRTVDSVELAGWTHNFGAASITIEDALIQAAFDVQQSDGLPDYCFMNNQDWRKLELSLGTFTRYEEATFQRDGAVFGFKSIVVQAGPAAIKVLPDPFCPQGEAFMLTLDRWVLKTAGDAPKILDRDGLYVRYMATDDVLECRIGYRGNLICESPKMNSHLYLPVGIGR
jgi:hypothetical protein